MMRASGLAGLVAMGAAARLACQAPEARVTLVRCTVRSNVPCVVVPVDLDAAERASAAGLDAGAEGGAWRGRLGGLPLVGAGVSRPRLPERPMRLLILVDRSAAMSGERTAFARIALKSWLAGLDTSTIRIAVAGIAGEQASADPAATPFGSAADAIAAIDHLPPPQAGASSPAYQAIASDVQGIGSGLRSSASSEGGALVITAGSRAPAVAGSTGRDELAAASTAIALTGRRVWVVVLGAGPATDDARALVGSAGSVTVVPVDPNALANRLTTIAREFPHARQLTFGLGATEGASLGRVAMRGTAELRGTAGIAAVRTLYWQPPLLAMPAFQGVADSGALSPPLKEILLAGGGGSDRPLIAMLVALVVLSLWLLVPRLAWIDGEEPRAPPRESATTRSDTMVGDLVETAPRKPEDITHQTARRTAMQR